MKIIRALKPGTRCRETATGLDGTVTHWICKVSQTIDYVFQPKGLNPEDHTPINRYRLELEQLDSIPEDSYKDFEVPVKILGSQVTDCVSGYTGTAVGFVLHLHGCFHVIIQAKGTVKDGGPIQRIEADLRECEGEQITIWEEVQKKVGPPPVSPMGDGLPESYLPGSRSVIS